MHLTTQVCKKIIPKNQSKVKQTIQRLFIIKIQFQRIMFSECYWIKLENQWPGTTGKSVYHFDGKSFVIYTNEDGLNTFKYHHGSP